MQCWDLCSKRVQQPRSIRAVSLSLAQPLQNGMICGDLLAQVHGTGQAKIPGPQRSVAAKQCNLLGSSCRVSERSGTYNRDFRDTELLPRISQVFLGDLIAGVVALRPDGAVLFGRSDEVIDVQALIGLEYADLGAYVVGGVSGDSD